jgi:hypothetical protein
VLVDGAPLRGQLEAALAAADTLNA